jgi:hypothetical protein
MYNSVKAVVGEYHTNLVSNFIHRREFYVTDAANQILIMCRDDSYRYSRNGITNFEFVLYGEQQQVVQLSQELQDRLRSKKLVKISWFYKTSRGNDSASMHVTGLNHQLHNEFYPWLPKGVDRFIEDYYASTANVLVVYGPPGTGKTSFLRHMLLSQNINAMVTYDERILKDDEFFINYLTDDEHNALIVEDADVFLAPREDGDNDMMSKFLNVSDGLIKIMNKKMIFTTNISQLSKIDAALLRPGRCFACVEFRELTSQEAGAAALAAVMAMAAPAAIVASAVSVNATVPASARATVPASSHAGSSARARSPSPPLTARVSPPCTRASTASADDSHLMGAHLASSSDDL